MTKEELERLMKVAEMLRRVEPQPEIDLWRDELPEVRHWDYEMTMLEQERQYDYQ